MSPSPSHPFFHATPARRRAIKELRRGKIIKTKIGQAYKVRHLGAYFTHFFVPVSYKSLFGISSGCRHQNAASAIRILLTPPI